MLKNQEDIIFEYKTLTLKQNEEIQNVHEIITQFLMENILDNYNNGIKKMLNKIE